MTASKLVMFRGKRINAELINHVIVGQEIPMNFCGHINSEWWFVV